MCIRDSSGTTSTSIKYGSRLPIVYSDVSDAEDDENDGCSTTSIVGARVSAVVQQQAVELTAAGGDGAVVREPCPQKTQSTRHSSAVVIDRKREYVDVGLPVSHVYSSCVVSDGVNWL